MSRHHTLLSGLLFAALTSSAACTSDAPITFGRDADFLWWSDHETGDLTDWTRDAPTRANVFFAGGGSATVETTTTARSGRHALSSTVPTGTAAAMVGRRGGAPEPAYYGAWFYVPAFARPATYWVFFALRTNTDVPLWDLKLAATAQDTLVLQLFRHGLGDVPPVIPLAVPTGRWFQVQAYFDATGAPADALRIWQDDTLVFTIAGDQVGGEPTAVPAWTLGTITDGLAPAPATLLVDDAFIATRHVPADAPPFWRAP